MQLLHTLIVITLVAVMASLTIAAHSAETGDYSPFATMGICPNLDSSTAELAARTPPEGPYFAAPQQ